MIDKSGNGDTYSELLSGSRSAEMKSDGLSLGPPRDRWTDPGGGERRGSSPPRTAGWQAAAWRRLLSVSGINRRLPVMRLCREAADECGAPGGWASHLVCVGRAWKAAGTVRDTPLFEAIYLSARRWITGKEMGEGVVWEHQHQFEALEVKSRFMDLGSTESKLVYKGLMKVILINSKMNSFYC